jgi:hypothetical protein
MHTESTLSTTPRRRGAALAGDGLLRVALQLDAVVTGANGVAYLALAGPLSDLLGLDASFLRLAGAFLIVFAAFVWSVSRQREISRTATLAVIAANLLWVADSVVLLISGWQDPTTAGAVWIALQAFTVAAFAVLQIAGRRRAL